MNKPILTRAASTDVTIANGRTLEGIALNYNQRDRVSNDGGRTWFYETFAPGSASKTLQERAMIPFPLGIWHPWSPNQEGYKSGEFDEPIGDVRFSSDDQHLYFRARVSNTPIGQDLVNTVRDNGSDVSVTFKPHQYLTESDGTVVYKEIELYELSLAPRALSDNPDARTQHEGAAVLMVRAVSPNYAKRMRQRADLDLWLPSA